MTIKLLETGTRFQDTSGHPTQLIYTLIFYKSHEPEEDGVWMMALSDAAHVEHRHPSLRNSMKLVSMYRFIASNISLGSTGLFSREGSTQKVHELLKGKSRVEVWSQWRSHSLFMRRTERNKLHRPNYLLSPSTKQLQVHARRNL